MKKNRYNSSYAAYQKREAAELRVKLLPVFILGGAALTAAVAYGLSTTDSGDAVKGKPVYTNSQFDQMPQQSFTVGVGQGPDDVIRAVEPAVLNDSEIKFELEQYLNAEGKAKDPSGNPALEYGQGVDVPIVPVTQK